jgi:hypothetical protein
MTLDTYSHYLPSMGDQASGAMGDGFCCRHTGSEYFVSLLPHRFDERGC